MCSAVGLFSTCSAQGLSTAPSSTPSMRRYAPSSFGAHPISSSLEESLLELLELLEDELSYSPGFHFSLSGPLSTLGGGFPTTILPYLSFNVFEISLRCPAYSA